MAMLEALFIVTVALFSCHAVKLELHALMGLLVFKQYVLDSNAQDEVYDFEWRPEYILSDRGAEAFANRVVQHLFFFVVLELNVNVFLIIQSNEIVPNELQAHFGAERLYYAAG